MEGDKQYLHKRRCLGPPSTEPTAPTQRQQPSLPPATPCVNMEQPVEAQLAGTGQPALASLQAAIRHVIGSQGSQRLSTHSLAPYQPDPSQPDPICCHPPPGATLPHLDTWPPAWVALPHLPGCESPKGMAMQVCSAPLREYRFS